MPWDDRVRRRFKLRDLDIVMTVIEAGSMGKAAARLNTTQPVVSKAVAELEHTLGVRLLDRSRRGAEPTPYGSALLRRGVAIFDEIRQGVRDIDFLADPSTGELRLGTTEPVAAAIVAPVIERFNRQFPRMAFYVVHSESAMTLYLTMRENHVEFVISRFWDAAPEKYSAETLFHDSLVVVTGADNPLTRRRRIDLADLMDEPWVLQPLDTSFGSMVAGAFRASGLPFPRLTIGSTSVNLRNELLATGRFLTVVPAFSLRLPRRHPSLKALAVELPNMRHPIAIITLKNRSLSPLALLFLERVRAITKPLAKS